MEEESLASLGCSLRLSFLSAIWLHLGLCMLGHTRDQAAGEGRGPEAADCTGVGSKARGDTLPGLSYRASRRPTHSVLLSTRQLTAP